MKDSIKNMYPLGFPWQTQDPFLFCVFHLDHYPKGNEDMGPAASLAGRNLGNDFTIKDGWRMYHGQTIPGFPYHPHRGFETITIVNKGYCDHSDSLGAAGRFGEGDVQWMTAGRGVQHSEMFPLLKTAEENPLELFQIWLNLPKSNKFVDPHFAMLWHEDIPMVQSHGSKVKVIAGSFKGNVAPKPAPNSWAADPENEVAVWNIHLEPNSEFVLPPTSKAVNRSLYFYEGDHCLVGEKEIASSHGIDLQSDQETVLKSSSSKASFLMLQGKPIDEPVAKYGPFVMNTDQEIQQAMQEYQLTQFGGWPWPYPDHVHPREKGRFAQYPDGSIVEK
ncbi:pirin family protein [Sediminicola sp. 1XM1-17]|uniref:pirin family protein n=1 Tax=Sediminicola sp. 1XM1-17 TaxID=3127702 RepID=UPI003076A426